MQKKKGHHCASLQRARSITQTHTQQAHREKKKKNPQENAGYLQLRRAQKLPERDVETRYASGSGVGCVETRTKAQRTSTVKNNKPKVLPSSRAGGNSRRGLDKLQKDAAVAGHHAAAPGTRKP